MVTRQHILHGIVGFILVVSLNIMAAAPSAGMDTVIMKDGTVIQGDATIGTYEVIIRTPDGRVITKDPRDVASITSADAQYTQYAARGVPELSLRLLFYVPTEDPWEQGIGGEVRYRYWFNENMAVGLTGSVSSWDIETQSGVYYYEDYGVAGQIEGDATFFGFGPMIVLRPVRQERMSISFSAGFEYVFVNSSINAELAVSDGHGGWYYARDEVDIDDGMVGTLGMELVYNMSPGIAFIFDGGYQFDVIKGDVSFLNTKIGDNEMAGAFMSFGLGFRF